jgi:hypothetical protein
MILIFAEPDGPTLPKTVTIITTTFFHEIVILLDNCVTRSCPIPFYQSIVFGRSFPCHLLLSLSLLGLQQCW